MLAVMLFVAPGEPGDSGEPAQPAFLNFDIALLVEPAGGLQVRHPRPRHVCMPRPCCCFRV